MIYFIKDSYTIQISSVDFDGLVPSDISLLLAYDHYSYKRVSLPIGAPLNGITINPQYIALSGKRGFQWYGGSKIKINHLKPNVSLSAVSSHFVGLPMSIYSDEILCSKVTMGGFKK